MGGKNNPSFLLSNNLLYGFDQRCQIKSQIKNKTGLSKMKEEEEHLVTVTHISSHLTMSAITCIGSMKILSLC